MEERKKNQEEKSKVRLVAVEHINPRFTNVTRVEWFLGMGCNLNCSYCAEHDSYSKFAPFKEIKKGVKKLKKKLKDREFILLLGGGEPSFHPEIEKIVEYMARENIVVCMITNGMMAKELYIAMLSYISEYTFSVHFEDDASKKCMESILAINDYIKKNKLVRRLNVHIVLAPGYFEQAKEVEKVFIDNEINYILRRVRPNFDDEDKAILPKVFEAERSTSRDGVFYTKVENDDLNNTLFKTPKNTIEYWENNNGEIEKVESNSNDILTRKLHHFKDWKCWVGIERLHIYPNGDVYRSTCLVGGKLGNIYKNFNFPEKPIICYNPKCTCVWAVNLSKAIDDKYLYLLEVGKV